MLHAEYRKLIFNNFVGLLPRAEFGSFTHFTLAHPEKMCSILCQASSLNFPLKFSRVESKRFNVLLFGKVTQKIVNSGVSTLRPKKSLHRMTQVTSSSFWMHQVETRNKWQRNYLSRA